MSQFYSERADKIEATLRALCNGSGACAGLQQLTQLRTEIKELIKFAALNYLAVVKAIKKRNRHLREHFGCAAAASAIPSLQALELLGHEVFFTSPRLASLATQTDVLVSKHMATGAGAGQQQQQPGEVLEEYQCPICLDTLHNPVVLTCAHRFCWGCLVAHVTATRDQQPALAPGQADGKAGDEGPSPASSLRLLERIAAQEQGGEEQQQRFYSCPVCRKPQLLDVDSLSIDPFLSSFIESLKVLSVSGNGATAAAVAHTQQVQQQHWGILPPQRPEHAGRLCVLLDLDGTLVSSYTPRRAPRLPPYVRTHLVGVGSKLNPQGVFVVERPGLREFLQELSAIAEVVVFTAGLEDYARPIVDAIDPAGAFFAHRIYREGTTRTDYYQCVKDMARVGRDLRRTVLVDDTPLAFLHQPDNGVPVLGFRGDPDDRLLCEAVLPLMQVLSKEADVRAVLQRRFDMATWFRRNNFPIDTILAEAREAVRREQVAALQGEHPSTATTTTSANPLQRSHTLPPSSPSFATTSAPSASPPGRSASSQLPSSSTPATAAISCPGSSHLPSRSPSEVAFASRHPRYVFNSARHAHPVKRFALVIDFDRTLTDVDAGEALTELLAPELLPMLVGLDGGPTNYIPITNTILSEMQRRGVSRDVLLSTLQQLGAEMPLASVELLRMMHGAQVDVRIVSDCNSVFIGHMLAGAKVSGYVTDVTTNPAAFERVISCSSSSLTPCSPSATTHDGGCGGAASSSPSLALERPTGHKLVIKSCFNAGDPQLVLASTQPAAIRTNGQRTAADGCCAGNAAGACPCRGLGHGCARCPENMCKGLEVRRLVHANTYAHIVYCGDGWGDVCAALELRPGDVLLARAGHTLERYVREAQANPELPQVVAQVGVWSTHEELLACVRQIMDV